MLRFYKSMLVLFFMGVAANCLAQSSVQVVQAQGRASIKAGDVAMARDEALIDARVKALEILGIEVDAERVLQIGRLVDETVINKTKGYIRDCRILNERQQEGMYYVEIEAWVTGEVTAEELKKYVRNFTVVTGFTVLQDGKQVTDDRPEGFLSEAFVDAGFQVLQKSQLLAGKNITWFKEGFGGDAVVARKIGERYLVNVVVIGKLDGRLSSSTYVPKTYNGGSGNILAYRAHGKIRAYEVDTGKIIAEVSTPYEGIKGFGTTNERAMENCFSNSLPPLIEQMMEKMGQYQRDKMRTITVRVSGIPDHDKYSQVKDLLASMRWVQNLKEKSFQAGGQTEFTLSYPEKIYILAASLNQMNMLQVVKQEWSGIELRYGLR